MRKVVVFDMDETLGHFVQLSMFDYYLTNMYNKKISRSHFFKMMDMFPKIISVLILCPTYLTDGRGLTDL